MRLTKQKQNHEKKTDVVVRNVRLGKSLKRTDMNLESKKVD